MGKKVDGGLDPPPGDWVQFGSSDALTQSPYLCAQQACKVGFPVQRAMGH